MKRRTLTICLVAILLISLTACKASKTDEQKAAQSGLTPQEAQDIALRDAGLTTTDGVIFDIAGYEIDDGVPLYEIEFHADGWEYDYEIHAETGAILSSHKEEEKNRPATVTDPAPTEAANRLTAEEVENIALDHAGLKRENVRFDRTESDVDEGVPEYEVEFHADGWEYNYEIHAETGEIISSEKDRDD